MKTLCTILAVLLAAALAVMFWSLSELKARGTPPDNTELRDSLAASQDSIRIFRANIAELDTSIARERRERDAAQRSRPPLQQRHRDDVAHFDTLGIGAAIDSLNASPIPF